MTTIRKFCCNDLLGFASVNLDHLTITTTMSNYLTWFAKWSDYCHTAVASGNRIIGYILGGIKQQSKGEHWRGFVQAVSVASEYRRLNLATRLVRLFETQLVDKMLLSPRDREYFVCVYVDIGNEPAILFFKQLAYGIDRLKPDFFSENKDAFDMRKKLSEEGDEEVIQFYELPVAR